MTTRSPLFLLPFTNCKVSLRCFQMSLLSKNFGLFSRVPIKIKSNWIYCRFSTGFQLLLRKRAGNFSNSIQFNSFRHKIDSIRNYLSRLLLDLRKTMPSIYRLLEQFSFFNYSKWNEAKRSEEKRLKIINYSRHI